MVLVLDCGGVLSDRQTKHPPNFNLHQTAVDGAYPFVHCFIHKYGEKELHGDTEPVNNWGDEGKQGNRGNNEAEPFCYHSAPEAFLEEILHGYYVKSVVDMTPRDWKLAFVCLRQRLGYCGICYNDTHAKTLEKRMLQRLQKEMWTPAAHSFLLPTPPPLEMARPRLSQCLTQNQSQSPKPKALPVSPSPSQRQNRNPRPKQRAATSGLAKTTVQRTRIKKKVSRSKGKKNEEENVWDALEDWVSRILAVKQLFRCIAAVSAV